MTATWTKIAKAVASGLAYAARTTAMREGLPWDDDVSAPASAGSGGGSGHHRRLSAPQDPSAGATGDECRRRIQK